ncbi:HAD family hydrolase [Haloarcula sp. S1AR25-5A]|uniref:HAD family hydrolase n=1 Tax=Haloarcula terrestris TaxID=2950533 RepID=A0AAE4EWZ8_9EURY|nr:HAD family hydrolase [Haloarcula terrestris]MDS0221517.1 HAD family hydrolase [Haloarcula terrestris]
MTHDAVIYDLDGTLVRLAVDWDAVASEVSTLLHDRNVDPGTRDLWEMLTLSSETGHRDAVEAAITDHERTGARSSDRLPLADGFPHSVPVGVCSLNAEEACRLALEVHDLDSYVGPVVGRDTVGSSKPDPEGLLAITDELGVDPDATVFVGDSESDATAAQRAGMAFEWASEFDQARYRA